MQRRERASVAGKTWDRDPKGLFSGTEGESQPCLVGWPGPDADFGDGDAEGERECGHHSLTSLSPPRTRKRCVLATSGESSPEPWPAAMIMYYCSCYALLFVMYYYLCYALLFMLCIIVYVMYYYLLCIIIYGRQRAYSLDDQH